AHHGISRRRRGRDQGVSLQHLVSMYRLHQDHRGCQAGGEAAMTSPREAGRSPQRKDILDKVTGRARYTSDLEAPGMAHACLARSKLAHGVIRSVDVSAALAMPGVVCVVTAS